MAGVLDISAAFINSGLNGRSPMFVLQSVASGLLGPGSYKGGFKSAALGALLHFLLLGRLLSASIGGLMYGVAVYLFMYLIVLPLTFRRPFSQTLSAVIIGVAIHMFCVGLPISLAVRRYSN